MAQNREAQTADRTEFFKFTRIGEGIAGLVQRADSNDNGDFIVMHPCMTRESSMSKWEMDDDYAIGMTTDLGMKLQGQRDVGRYFAIEFIDTEPNKRGQPKKIFRVTELSRDEVIGLRDGTENVLPPFASRLPVANAPQQTSLSNDF